MKPKAVLFSICFLRNRQWFYITVFVARHKMFRCQQVSSEQVDGVTLCICPFTVTYGRGGKLWRIAVKAFQCNDVRAATVLYQSIRKLKQRRRRKQRERHKTTGLMSKNSRFAYFISFYSILCLHHQDNNLKSPNSRFCGEREHTTINFSFPFLT